ncbi:YdeI/OmpD-associated family protein [Edaphocola aurantiacus]|uniref:YdeI/OmpD-associated family protein n=1 Tax=Edaphocola aurantiacus TaxID=2601682 RepID=UPI001C96F342|nr:YdeI/OmpD-associated family protein [Edaphocola aurantiacus]
MHNAQWEQEVEYLHSIIRKMNLDEAIKWGATIYTHKGRNVVACGGFNNFFSLWFYDGVFLSDPCKVLVNASEGKTKALRQWRFTGMEEIDPQKIEAYIREAIRNVDEGKTWTPERSAELVIPDALQEALDTDAALNEAFTALSLYKQKEYVEHIETAKRDATRLSRLEKIKPMILEGKGLNDKYR